MRRWICALAILACGLSAEGSALADRPKSALDHFQFDGITSDEALKDTGMTRRHWLEIAPAQAKDYWKAWDCKDKPCDSQWWANIRKKAALIKRTDKDPPPLADSSAKSK